MIGDIGMDYSKIFNPDIIGSKNIVSEFILSNMQVAPSIGNSILFYEIC